MPALMLSWSLEPWAFTSIAFAVIWYCLGLRRMRSRAGATGPARISAVAAFAAGMSTLMLALISPIDALGEQLFSAHMLQHLLLMMLAAPLIAWSRPALVFLWALPPRSRKNMGRAWSGFGLRRLIAGLMHPVAVWILFSGAFVFWHCPRPYAWALHNEAVHTIEHICLLTTALMFWTTVFEPVGQRRLGYGGTLLFITSTAVLSGLPGALMILSPEPLYAVHAAGVAKWGLTLVEDQQLAGLIMWIPTGAVYLAAACFAFLKWLGEADRRSQALLAAAALALVPVLSGCKDHQAKAVASRTGDPEHGAALIQHFGCGSCHFVPGIDNADGVVGPPLVQVGRRIYIAGLLRNTPPNMIRWLRYPQQVLPGNAMPDMDISEPDAKDVAAYLYTLR